ncbi:urokinase plasminogen activator surface receptor-like [Vanacampus margaritifer]
MHHLLLLAGILLLPKAYTLKCYKCQAEGAVNCVDSIQECGVLDTHCGAVRMKLYAGESVLSNYYEKSCNPAEVCVQGSINFGVTRSVFTSQCCTTDLCNNAPAPDTSMAKPNGRKCYTCNELQCDATLECLADEDRCLSARVEIGSKKVNLKGCASEQMCASANLGRSIGSRQTIVEVGCCDGNFCNSGSRPAVGLLLLVAPLLSVMMWP